MAQDDYGYTQRKRSSTDKIPLIMLLVFLAAIILMDYLFKLNLNWVDYTIIGVVFFCAFVGYVRGLIGAVFSLAGYLAAVVCAVLFSEPVALLIMEKTKIGESISKALEDAYASISIPSFSQAVDFSGIQNNNQLLDKFPDLKSFFSENSMFGTLFNNVNPFESGAKAVGDAITSIADVLVFSVIKVISIIAVFFVVKLIISIIGRLINSMISQNNFLSTTNKTIGLALGAIIGCLIVFVAVSYIVPFIGSMNIINIPQEYEQSQVIGWIFTTPPPAS